jgi:hypothetical protein
LPDIVLYARSIVYIESASVYSHSMCSYFGNIAFMNTAGSNDLYMLKCIGEESSVYNAPIEWTKQFAGFAGYQPSAIDRVEDAGFLVACNAAGAKPLILKTDSAAWVGGCEGYAFTATRTVTSTYPTQSVSNTAAVLVPPVTSPASNFERMNYYYNKKMFSPWI